MSGARPRWTSVLWGLARTRYVELVRQPVFGIALLVGLFLVGLSPALAIFSLGKAEALVLDLGASALLFFCVLLSALAVSAGAAERLSDGTTALLLTHPVGPTTVLLGELLGAALALMQASFLMSIALAWATRHGPDHLHGGVLGGVGVALAGSVAWGIRASLKSHNVFSASLAAATLLFPLCWFASQFLDAHGEVVAFAAAPKLVWEAGCFAWQAALAFAALGLCLGTRLGPGASAGGTLLLFVLASLVRGPLGPEALGAAGHLSLLLPDLQLYWVGDAGYAEKAIPTDYLAMVALCTALHVTCFLGLASALLERRELS